MLSLPTKTLASLHVAELARKAAVTPATVRYYARTGLIHPDREPENGYRCFSGSDLRRVVFIRQAQALGLTISDIKTILDTIDRGEVSCHQVKSLVEQRLVSIRERIAELRATETRIGRAISTWEMANDQAAADGEFCPLIEHLDATNGDLPLPTRRHTRKSNGACDRLLANGSTVAAPA